MLIDSYNSTIFILDLFKNWQSISCHGWVDNSVQNYLQTLDNKQVYRYEGKAQCNDNDEDTSWERFWTYIKADRSIPHLDSSIAYVLDFYFIILNVRMYCLPFSIPCRHARTLGESGWLMQCCFDSIQI